MKTKEITICGKQVTLAYCFATEISYKILAEEDITDFVQAAITAIKTNQMPDTKKSICAILAATQAFCDGNGIKDYPITDSDLMFNASGIEIGVAIGTIIGLHAEFYQLPQDEPEDNPPKSGKKRKNA